MLPGARWGNSLLWREMFGDDGFLVSVAWARAHRQNNGAWQIQESEETPMPKKRPSRRIDRAQDPWATAAGDILQTAGHTPNRLMCQPGKGSSLYLHGGDAVGL